MKMIMKKAVAMARKMEGDWQARMSLALKKVWAIVKKAKEQKSIVSANMNFNEWANYGYHRVYFKGTVNYTKNIKGNEIGIRAKVDGFYDIESGYIKFKQCNTRDDHIIVDYIYKKLLEMTFKKEAKKVA